MVYTTQALPAVVMRLLEEQLYSRRNAGRFKTVSWNAEELILAPRVGDGQVIMTLRDGRLTLSYAPKNEWIVAEIRRVLTNSQIDLKAQPQESTQLTRRYITHAHMRGDCRPRANKSRKERKNRQTAYLLSQALEEAAAIAGKWVVISNEARKSAARYRYVYPGEITHAIVTLGEAAKLNTNGGVGVEWSEFMSDRKLKYSPHSSDTAMNKFAAQYRATVNGVRVPTPGHVSFGTGKPPYCARIYVHQPDKPGDPVIIGSVGPHLDIASRNS